jgi:mannose-1-phosphate guanylyltransferase/mannose-6-phosphate isomerase
MIPVILSGGSGTRLWPVSRASHPKQFVELLGEPLLTRTLRRVSALGSPWVLAVAEQRFLTRKVLADLDLPVEQGLYEPFGRNTAPAVAFLCRFLELEGRAHEVVGLFPADHWIPAEEEFRQAVALAERCAQQGQVVTLGIEPTYPATGYGYIETDPAIYAASESHRAHRVRRFREKPDEATATALVAAGNYLWNAGMFVFRVDTMAAAFARHMPGLWAALGALRHDLSNLRTIYADLEPQSLDYGIMEHLDNQVTLPCDLGWSDVGSWEEVARLLPESERVFRSEAPESVVVPYRDKLYGLIGVSDVVVVDTADALLITRRGASQQVKGLLDQVKAAGHRAAAEHVYEHRPWGSFEILAEAEHFKAKILRVDPGQRLSYQSHRFRSEHWVVVRGRPHVVLDGTVHELEAGRSIFIPQGAKHRIENPGAEPAELIEVQTGSYFGEDDIERFEDDYQRS